MPCSHSIAARRAALPIVACAVPLLSGAITGCGAHRDIEPEATLVERRTLLESELTDATVLRIDELAKRLKRELDQYTAGERATPPVFDVLVISGGGDWGAFGAGFIKGWRGAGASITQPIPDFDVVMGVSTGALIAPFAFLGDAESDDRIVQLYRNPNRDWVRQRGLLYFLPVNESLATVPGLEREVRAVVDPRMIRRIADEHEQGRLLVVNTTDLDNGEPRPWDLGSEAVLLRDKDDLDRIHRILLASAGIPGAFPPRFIDDRPFVDGAVTSNIIYGGRLHKSQTFQARWRALYPGAPIPAMRYWVILNNQLLGPPRITQPGWLSAIGRSVEIAMRYSTITALRHLFAMSEAVSYREDCIVEVRFVAIPEAWRPPVEGVFQKPTMDSLADLGEELGGSGAAWIDDF